MRDSFSLIMSLAFAHLLDHLSLSLSILGLSSMSSNGYCVFFFFFLLLFSFNNKWIHSNNSRHSFSLRYRIDSIDQKNKPCLVFLCLFTSVHQRLNRLSLSRGRERMSAILRLQSEKKTYAIGLAEMRRFQLVDRDEYHRYIHQLTFCQ